MADLITSDFALQAIAAGGRTLSAAQTTHLATAISVASLLCKRQCGGRDFVRADYDEVLDLAYDGTVALPQMPVNSVDRLCSVRQVALTISNDDQATNQRAAVKFASSGDVETGLSYTGLVLTRVASGVSTSTTLLFAAALTLADLAAAVNALGASWSATVADGYGAWASTELHASDAPARSAFGGADIEVWLDDDGSIDWRIDRRTGIVQILSWRPWGTGQDIRVQYNAGFDTVPQPVQEACAELTLDLLDQMARDPRISSETVGAYSYVANTAFADYALPKPVIGKLAPYVIYRL